MEDQYSRPTSQRQDSSNYEKLHNYQLGKVIGSGSFSKVRLARHLPTGIQVAVKIVNLQKLCRLDAERGPDQYHLFTLVNSFFFPLN